MNTGFAARQGLLPMNGCNMKMESIINHPNYQLDIPVRTGIILTPVAGERQKVITNLFLIFLYQNIP
jgi:hypothetical protein